MAGLTLLAIGAATAATAAGIQQQRRARKDAERQAKQQQTAAREAAALEGATMETGANVEIGAQDDQTVNRSGRSRRRAARGSALSVGGVSASNVGGL